MAAVILLGLSVAALTIDLQVRENLTMKSLRGDVAKAIALSEFFAHGFGVFLILLTVAVLVPQLRRRVPRVAVCAAASGMLADFLKGMIARGRPSRQPQPEQIGETFLGWFPAFQQSIEESGYAIQSFPSAHTATAFGLAMGLTWLVPRGKWLFFVFATLAGLQRIFFEAHWLSDTFAGAAIATLVSGTVLYGRRTNHFWSLWESGRTESGELIQPESPASNPSADTRNKPAA